MGDNNRAIVTLLTENVTEQLKDYFNSKIIPDKGLQSCVIKEIGDKSITFQTFTKPNPLDAIICCYLDRLSLSGDKPSEAFKKVKERKRQLKRNKFKLIREESGELEISKRNPQFLKHDCDMFLFMKNIASNNDAKKFSNVDEYRAFKYNLVKSWHDDTESLLIEFEYLDALKADIKARSFLSDLECYIYSYICDNLHNNPYDGNMTKIPEKALEAPYFNYRKSNMNLEVGYENEGNSVSVFENYEQGAMKITTTVDTIPVGDRTPLDVIQGLEEKYVLTQNAKSLDTEDLEVLTSIFSLITGDNIVTGRMSVDMKTLYHEYFGADKKTRSRDYKPLLERIEKLANCTLKMTMLDKETKMLQRSILHFFDVSFFIPMKDKDDGGEVLNRYDLSNVDELTDKYDLGKTVIDLTLGDTIKDAWNTNKVMRVCSHIYDRLDNSKAKALLFILEEQRIKSYPGTEARISVKEIGNRLRFSKQERQKKAIAAILDSFIDRDSIIESYSFSVSNVLLTFKPLTDYELASYNITPHPQNLVESVIV